MAASHPYCDQAMLDWCQARAWSQAAAGREAAEEDQERRWSAAEDQAATEAATWRSRASAAS
jgi:hypothetical protein